MEGPLFQQCCGIAAYRSQEQSLSGNNHNVLQRRASSSFQLVLHSLCGMLCSVLPSEPAYCRDYQLLPANTTRGDQCIGKSPHTSPRTEIRTSAKSLHAKSVYQMIY